jgi:hypothetical protein
MATGLVVRLLVAVALLLVCGSLAFRPGAVDASTNARRVNRTPFFPSSLFAAVAETTEDTSLGAPHNRPTDGAYVSQGGINVEYKVDEVPNAALAISDMVDLIDDHKGAELGCGSMFHALGTPSPAPHSHPPPPPPTNATCAGVLLTSSYEYPGRYKRWSVGFVAPALQLEGRGLDFVVTPLNERGVLLASFIRAHLQQSTDLFRIAAGESGGEIRGSVIPSTRYFPEEERSKQPSLFSLIRSVQELFSSPDAGQLGLYGALGYDLTFQFEPITLSTPRDADQRDLVMFLPDEILVVDNQKKAAWKIKYDFASTRGAAASTKGLPRTMAVSPFVPADANVKFDPRDGAKGKYADSVVVAKEEFRVGNLFEVVLSQAFRELLKVKPSTVFRRYVAPAHTLNAWRWILLATQHHCFCGTGYAGGTQARTAFS